MVLSCSKILSTLLRGITSKHQGDFYCLNCLHSFSKGNKPKSYEKVCKNIFFGEIAMLLGKDNIMEFNQYMNSDKIPYIIHADTESLTKEQMDVQTIHKIHQQQK